MKYKMFTGQGAELEKKINDWLTPNIEPLHVAQSTVSAVMGDKNVPYTILSIFYHREGDRRAAQSGLRSRHAAQAPGRRRTAEEECRRRESNPYEGNPRQILSLMRLPIPPLRLEMQECIIISARCFVNAGGKKWQ